MSNTAYIVAGFRSAVGKAKKGGFRFYRPDDIGASVIKHLVKSIPNLDKDRIDDVIVGNATPEAEQGLNMGRMLSLMGLDTDKVPGMTVNRYCASGLETIAIAQAKIESGMADCIIAGGAESMSIMAMGGWRIVPNARVGKENPNWYWGMGLPLKLSLINLKLVERTKMPLPYIRMKKQLAQSKKVSLKMRLLL